MHHINVTADRAMTTSIQKLQTDCIDTSIVRFARVCQLLSHIVMLASYNSKKGHLKHNARLLSSNQFVGAYWLPSYIANVFTSLRGGTPEARC